MGFSRGSTVALMASNLIYERGVTAPLRADGSPAAKPNESAA